MIPGTRRPVDPLGVVVVVSVCAALGSQQAAIKAIAGYMSPSLQLAVRSGVAAALIGLIVLWRRRRRTSSDRNWLPGLGAGALFAAEFLLLAQALTLTSAGRAVVFLYTAPVFAAVGLHLTSPDEKLHARGGIGVSAAFLGVALAFFEPNAQGNAFGDLLAVGAGLCFGATTVLIRLSSLSEAEPEETLLYQLAVCFVVLACAVAIGGAVRMPAMPAWAGGILAFQALGVSVLTYLAWFWLLRRYPAGRISAMSFLTPLFGVLISAAWLGEPLRPRFIAGSALVVAGVACVTWREGGKPRG